MRLGEEFREFPGQAAHLRLKGFAVVFLFLNAHVAAGGEDVILLGDVRGGGDGAEALDGLQRAVHKGRVGRRQFLDVALGQFPQFAGYHGSHFAGVDKECLALLPFVSIQEPEGDWDLCGVEELGRHGDDTVHQIVLDDVFADFALAAGLGGEGAVGQHHADAAVGGQVPDHVLEPREVGVAGGRRAVLPADVTQEPFLPPAGEVEGRVGQDEVRLQLGVTIVEEGVGVILAQVGLDASDGEVHLGQLPGGGVGVLPENGDPVDVAAVAFDELG